MIRYIILLSFILSASLCSCSGRRSKTEHKNIIPERDLIAIITEIHLTGGLLTVSDIFSDFTGTNEFSVYSGIFEKYGYSKEIMDKTMRYYFIKRPKKLIKIYDKALGMLSEMESRIEQEMPLPEKTYIMNLWKGKAGYSFPGLTPDDSTWFEFPVEHPGSYILKFTLTIFPGDQSLYPHCGVFYSYIDSTLNETRDYFSTIPFIKDGYAHEYSITKRTPEGHPLILKGWFIYNENQSGDPEKYVRVENISFTRQAVR